MEVYFEHMSFVNVKVDYTDSHLCRSVVFTSEQLTLSTTKYLCISLLIVVFIQRPLENAFEVELF